MMITVLVDNKDSWIFPYAEELVKYLRVKGHRVDLVNDQGEIKAGDCAFFLGCEKKVSKESLTRNTHNLVVHESALPEGKGWSPLSWQILEGKNDIPITLFEAREDIDGGDIYLADIMHFAGHELNSELKDRQGRSTIDLVKNFLDEFSALRGRQQTGKETFYRRRIPADSELNVDKTIAEQFDLLRIVDNDRYPAWFNHRGHKYIIKIHKADEK